MTKERLEKEFFRIDEVPFDSDRKCMSVICNNQKGESMVFTKGAPDILIKKCDYALINDKLIKLDPKLKEEILEANNKMAAKALRVIALAHKKVKSKPEDLIEVENELVFVGLIGMLDPPRAESFDAVRKCILAGIKPIMITGDHKITAAAIANEIGILPRSGLVLTGEELDKMTDQKLEKTIGDVSVFARVSPKNKLRIVKCFKKLGHVVAMTGDGVNDAPAVKEADIGISMGITGTDVTKEASAMILLDDNFATIIAAVEEGRVIYNNIRKFIRYMLACNIGEVLTMFLGMLLGLPLPLLPIQILWVNLVTDGLPAIALGLEPADSDIMKRRPRRSNENIFSDGLLGTILLRGAMIGVFTLLVFISVLELKHSIPLARSCTFVTLVITQLIHVFECKSEKKSIFHISFFNNLYLIFSVICSLAMMLGVVYIDTFQVIFKTVAITKNEWLIILGFSALGPVLSSFITLRKRN